MENVGISNSWNFTNYHSVESQYCNAGKQVDIIENKDLFEKLDAEGCKSFYHYLNWLGLAKDPNLILLSPTHHYYYETEDLKEINVLVNLKHPNEIDQLIDFFYNIFQILPFESYFIGCFLDKKDQNVFVPDSHKPLPEKKGWVDLNENRIVLRIPFVNMMFSKIDFRTKRNLTNGCVTTLLEEAHLKVLDMTKLNGLTYFCAQKIQSITIYDQLS